MSDQVKPVRVQLSRRKGWRIPPNTVKVARPSKWGNPFQVVDVLDAYCGNKRDAAADCVRSYRQWLHGDEAYIALTSPVEVRNELRGKNLACWCPLDHPCHADVLLEIANG
jgi:hypothetical protein